MLALPTASFGQDVADRTLSDVKVVRTGDCTTLTVNFNIRIQMLSYFPQSGRELHVRVRPLDAATPGVERESLRSPASVPELRSIEFEGDNPSGPVLSLFFTEDMRYEIEAGSQPQSLVIRIAKPGTGPICTTASKTAKPARVEPAKPEPALPPGVVIPPGLYVVNIDSQQGASGDLTAAQKEAVAGQIVYHTQFERDAQQWHRTRIGFYETREAAEAAKAALAAQFPDAFVIKVSAEERTSGVVGRIDTGAPLKPIPALPTPAFGATEADAADTAKLIDDAEQAIRETNNDRAIALLTNALGKPENVNTPRALELLGLTRERKGQTAHAQAEYEEYLRRYPAGEASERVRERLAALGASSTGAGPGQELRATSGEVKSASAWEWGVRGSFSQFYFRDQNKTRTIDASKPDIDPEIDNRVNLNQLLTSGDITISGGNDRRQMQMRAAGSYSRDFRPPSKSVGIDPLTGLPRVDPVTGDPILKRNHLKSLTALYLDYTDSTLDLSTRIGRQTRNSAGVLGRFDGMLLSWQPQPKLRLNVVGGFPVSTSRQTYVAKNRYFYGASVDVGAKRDAFQTTLYWFDQRARGGFIDRQSVGVEARILKKRFNAFGLVDYDVKYKKLNLALFSMNYNFPDTSSFSLTADYRRQPLLTTHNILQGLSYTNPALAVIRPDLPGLRPFFSDEQIYQGALDNTSITKSTTVSYSRPISKKLQANFDFTMSNTGGTRGIAATAGTNAVDAQPRVGREYFYGAQLVGTGLFWESDIFIVSGRYSDTQKARAHSVDFNARVPITSNFRLSPRVRYGKIANKFDEGYNRQVQPTVRFNLYPMRNSEVEVEVGANFVRERSITAGLASDRRETGLVISAGYRIDF